MMILESPEPAPRAQYYLAAAYLALDKTNDTFKARAAKDVEFAGINL